MPPWRTNGDLRTSVAGPSWYPYQLQGSNLHTPLTFRRTIGKRSTVGSVLQWEGDRQPR
jgi:hypothetical protein